MVVRSVTTTTSTTSFHFDLIEYNLLIMQKKDVNNDYAKLHFITEARFCGSFMMQWTFNLLSINLLNTHCISYIHKKIFMRFLYIFNFNVLYLSFRTNPPISEIYNHFDLSCFYAD